MGTSAKKKREKKQDFQKPKLKVGKARPKNTNATDTSFAAKSIVLKQQSLSDLHTRDGATQFKRHLSLLTGTETQKKDALAALTAAVTQARASSSPLPESAALILAKVQPLLFDASSAVRAALLRLLHALPFTPKGSGDGDGRGEPTDFLLWARAGLTNLSIEVRLTALAALEWLLEVRGAAVLGLAPGGWVKTLRTFQALLGWSAVPVAGDGGDSSSLEPAIQGPVRSEEKWTAAPKTGLPVIGNGSLASGSKLLVRQLSVLAKLLTMGLERAGMRDSDAGLVAAREFPLWKGQAYAIPGRSRAYGRLNLFGAPRDAESEVYDDPEERAEVFVQLGMNVAFAAGIKEAKKEGGEVGRAAAMVDKALRLVNDAG